jgi:hypothetical protein
MVIVLNVELLQQLKALDVTMSVKSIHLIAVAVLTFLSGAGVFGQTPLACADYYRYTDNKGVICITNNLNAIPPKYRSTMKVIREDKPGRLDRGSQTQTTPDGSPVVLEPATAGHARQAVTSSQSDSRFSHFMSRFPLFKLLIIIAGIVAASVIIIKLTSLIPSPQLARLINIAFFLGLFVFAYKLYAENLVGNYFSIKTKVLWIFTGANVREAPETGVKLPEASGETP